MKSNPIKQYVIYSRKSKFTGKGESIENQIELCRRHIAALFSKEEADAALIYEDEGFSGGNLERPQFKKMMRDSQEKQFAAIVVYRLDRISRNISDFAKLIEDLGEREIDFISIREQFDTSSPMGRAMMYIASVFSQLERETIAERIRDNMHELAKTGRWLGGTTPTGYESESIAGVSVDGKTRKVCKLKIIPEEISLVKLIFDKFIETQSLTKTDAFLLQGKYMTKRGKEFTRFAIRGILTNPVYMIADDDAYGYLVENNVELFSKKENFDGKHGVMAYNRTLQRPGRANRERPMDEWIVSVGRHKGVIPGGLWVSVQKLLELNKSKSYRRPRSNVALLSGMLYCGSCGDYMRPKLSDRLTAEGETVYAYICAMKERSRGTLCKMKNASGNVLDAKIIAEVKKLGTDSAEMARRITQAKRALKGGGEGCEAQISGLNEQIEEHEASIKALVSSLAKSGGAAAEQYIVRRIGEIHEKITVLKKRLEELELAAKHHTLADIEFDLIRRLLSAFEDNIGNYSVEQKRTAVRTFVKRVVWDGGNARLYLAHNDCDHCFPGLPASRGGSGGGGDSPDSPKPLGEDSK